MTPAERIPFAKHLQALLAVCGHNVSNDDIDMVIDMSLGPKGQRIVLDRTGDTDRLTPPFDIWLLAERLRIAEARLLLLAHDGGPAGRPRLEAKAEGVRLALSYITDQTRPVDSPEGGEQPTSLLDRRRSKDIALMKSVHRRTLDADGICTRCGVPDVHCMCADADVDSPEGSEQ